MIKLARPPFLHACFGLLLLASGTSCRKLGHLRAEVEQTRIKIETARANSDAFDDKLRQLDIRNTSQFGLKTMLANKKTEEKEIARLEQDLADAEVDITSLQIEVGQLEAELKYYQNLVKE